MFLWERCWGELLTVSQGCYVPVFQGLILKVFLKMNGVLQILLTLIRLKSFSLYPGSLKLIIHQLHVSWTNKGQSIWRDNPILNNVRERRRGKKKSVSQNHRMVEVGRDLCASSSATPLWKQVHLEQAAQELVQAGLEYLQRRRLHKPCGSLFQCSITLEVKNHIIIESLRLEKTSGIRRSNHQPNTTMHAKTCPEVSYLHIFLSTSSDATASLGSLFQCFTTPLKQLEAIASHPIASYLGEETNTCLTTTSFQVVVESNKVFPQPSLLQAKQSQFPQLLLIKPILSHQPCCSSLETLQQLNVFLVVRGPKLNTVLNVQPHQCRVQGHNHFLTPASQTISDTSQDALSPLGHLGTLLAHVQLSTNTPRSFSSRQLSSHSSPSL